MFNEHVRVMRDETIATCYLHGNFENLLLKILVNVRLWNFLNFYIVHGIILYRDEIEWKNERTRLKKFACSQLLTL